MDFLVHRNRRLFNIFTISLPLVCFLLSWFATITTSSTSPTNHSSALAAADVLRHRGYTTFASTIHSTLSTTNFNLSGTIFAPPDFTFRRPRKPSTSLLLFHTLKQQLNLSSSFPSSDNIIAVPTLYNNLCLFITKTPTGDTSISSSSINRPISAVKVRHPNLYVDDQLTVHGIDGVLDPVTAKKCDLALPLPPPRPIESEFGANTLSYLDHAVRVLNKRGFHVAATALAIKRSHLLNLNSLTLFVPSDNALFFNQRPNGFRFDFLRHVVPLRLRFSHLSVGSNVTAFETLAPNKSLMVQQINNGSVTVDGIPVEATEIYHNRWMVVFAIPTTLDDGQASVPEQYSPIMNSLELGQAIADQMEVQSTGSAKPCANNNEEMPVGLEGGDLLCPYTADRKLLQQEIDQGEAVHASKKESTNTQIGPKDDGHLDVADDLFFYS